MISSSSVQSPTHLLLAQCFAVALSQRNTFQAYYNTLACYVNSQPLLCHHNLSQVYQPLNLPLDLLLFIHPCCLFRRPKHQLVSWLLLSNCFMSLWLDFTVISEICQMDPSKAAHKNSIPTKTTQNQMKPSVSY